MNKIECRVVLAAILIDKVRRDRYPSSTQMSIIEQVLPSPLLSCYVEMLLDKVAQDNRPSIPMLHRIQRVIGSVP